MSTKQQLLQELDAAYNDFLSTFADLDEHEFDTKWLDSKWGVREIVAHITGWLGQLGGGLERMSRGEKPTPEGVNWTDTQPWNEIFAQHVMGKRKEQVLDELERALNAFKDAAARVPDDRFGEGKTANRMFDGAGIEHMREHAAMIREWRQRQR